MTNHSPYPCPGCGGPVTIRSDGKSGRQRIWCTESCRRAAAASKRNKPAYKTIWSDAIQQALKEPEGQQVILDTIAKCPPMDELPDHYWYTFTALMLKSEEGQDSVLQIVEDNLAKMGLRTPEVVRALRTAIHAPIKENYAAN